MSMDGLRNEVYAYTVEQVEEHLKRAEALIDDLQLAPDIRAAAFTAAISMLSNKQVIVQAVQPGAVDLSMIPRRGPNGDLSG